MRSCCVFQGLLLTRRGWERCWERSGNSFTSTLIAIHGESSPPVNFPALPLTLFLLAWNFSPTSANWSQFHPFINAHYLIGQAEQWPRGFWAFWWHFVVGFFWVFFFHFASLDTILSAKYKLCKFCFSLHIQTGPQARFIFCQDWWQNLSFLMRSGWSQDTSGPSALMRSGHWEGPSTATGLAQLQAGKWTQIPLNHQFQDVFMCIPMIKLIPGAARATGKALQCLNVSKACYSWALLPTNDLSLTITVPCENPPIKEEAGAIKVLYSALFGAETP